VELSALGHEHKKVQKKRDGIKGHKPPGRKKSRETQKMGTSCRKKTWTIGGRWRRQGGVAPTVRSNAPYRGGAGTIQVKKGFEKRKALKGKNNE